MLESPQEFLKVGSRSAMVISVTSLALITYPETQSVGIGLGAVNPRPTRARQAEEFIKDFLNWESMQVDPSGLDRFKELVSEASRPIDDHRSVAAYRRYSIGVLAQRALTRIFSERSPSV